MSDTGFRGTGFGTRGFGPRGSGQARLTGRPRISWVLLGLIGLLMLPSLEIAAFVAVAAHIGFAPALLAFVLTSLIGAALLKQQGGAALRRIAEAVRRGQRPEGAVRDGLWFAVGGVLMIVPGFVTDALGFALMLPTLIRGWGSPAPMPAPVPASVRARPRGAEDGIVDLSASEWRTVSEGTRR